MPDTVENWSSISSNGWRARNAPTRRRWKLGAHRAHGFQYGRKQSIAGWWGPFRKMARASFARRRQAMPFSGKKDRRARSETASDVSKFPIFVHCKTDGVNAADPQGDDCIA